MGWMFRRSVGLGPFRVNLGRSGVGWSVGGGGFRTGVSSRGRRYSSYSLTGTGLRYIKTGSGSGCLIALAALPAAVWRIGGG
jgi:hypothetical protein